MNQKKVGRGDKSGTRQVWLLDDPMEAQDFSQNLTCFLNCFVPKNFGIQTHHSFLLWKSTIIGTSRPCTKSTSLGYGPNCYKYFGCHGPTLGVEPKPRLLIISNALVIVLSFLCQMRVDSLTPNSYDT
jgi:hypothetical protein